MALMSYAGIYDRLSAGRRNLLVEASLSWMILRWFAANLSSNGQPLPIAFNGSVWAYLGWYILMVLSFITIIGWAWVSRLDALDLPQYQGTRREVVFNGTGLEICGARSSSASAAPSSFRFRG